MLLTEPKSLLRFVSNEMEHELAVAVLESPQIVNVPAEQIVNLVALWRMYIGIPKTDVAEEIAFISSYIHENYYFLTLSEIELAIKLSAKRILKDAEFTGYFSPMYVSKVLDSFLYYRKITMAEPIRQRELAINEEKEKMNKPSPEEQARRFQELFRNFYIEWQKTGEINDPFSLAYNYLRKNNLLPVSKQMVADAQEYGKKKADEYIKARQKSGRKISFKISDIVGMEEKKWARNYCVQKFFENVDIENLCSKIISTHFN